MISNARNYIRRWQKKKKKEKKKVIIIDFTRLNNEKVLFSRDGNLL